MAQKTTRYPAAELIDTIAADIETLAGPYPDRTWTDEMLEVRESWLNELCGAQVQLHRNLASAWSRHHTRIFRLAIDERTNPLPLAWMGDTLQRELDFAVCTSLMNIKQARDDFNDTMKRHERGDLCIKPVAFRFGIV